MAIRSYARDDDHADDLLQDCWQVILERLHCYGGRGSFVSWAIAVSRNVCRMRFRQEKRAGGREIALLDAGEPVDRAPNPEEALVARQRREKLYRALGQLPGRERDAIVLRVIEDRDAAETAEALGVSSPAARALVARAILKLARMKDIQQLAVDRLV